MHIKVHGLGANLKQQAMGISRGRVSKQTRPKIEKPPLNPHSYGLDLVSGGLEISYFGVTEQIANPIFQ